MDGLQHESIVKENPDPLISILNKIVVVSVKILAILMVIVIWLALADVVVHLSQQVFTTPYSLFTVEALISLLGDFLAVMIAIEIFLNIVFYLKKDAIHAPLVLSTALTAVARKVIILDYATSAAPHIYAIAAVIFAVGITYWLVTKKTDYMSVNGQRNI
jgi:uncharacterized membrane protein (DUF373 family)